LRKVGRKPLVRFGEVEVAMEDFVSRLKSASSETVIDAAEQHLHDVIFAYVRYQSHQRLPHNDRARFLDNSSNLGQNVLLYLYTQKHLPEFIARVKANPTEEAVNVCLEFVSTNIHCRIKNQPREDMRVKKNNSLLFVPNDDARIAHINRKDDCPEGMAQKTELDDIILRTRTGFSDVDQEIYSWRQENGLAFGEIAEKLNMNLSTVTKRFKKLIMILQQAITEAGYEI